MKKFTGYFRDIINRGHIRSVKAKKNIVASFGIKAVGLLAAFVKVPVVLLYLDVEKYGIWLTIASIVTWVHYFDLGVGHGLRNKFAMALAEDDNNKARKLVSTSYFYITLIFAGISLVIIPLILIVDWQAILNARNISNLELLYSVLVVYMLFVVRFVLNLITMIMKADQRPALADSLLPVGSIISLLLLLLLGQITEGSLFLACVAIAAPPVLVVLIANLVLFSGRYVSYSPSLKDIEKSLFKDIFSLGFKFFFIQLAGLIMFSTSNIILTQIVNPSEVSLFNIARQYYGLPFMFFGIVLSPFWSAITDAYTRGDLEWIKRVMKMLLRISVVFCGLLLIMLLFSESAFKFWLRGTVSIPLEISVTMVVLNLFYILFAPFTHFINGVGKLNLSLWVVSFKMILFLPVAIFLTQQFNAAGLILALIIVNSIPSAILESFQYKKVISGKTNGIWGR